MQHVIAIQYWQYALGGAERVTHNLLERLTNAGHRVYLVTDVAPTPDDLDVPQGVERLVAPEHVEDRTQFWVDLVKEKGVELVIYSTWLSLRAAQDCADIRAAGARLVYQTHGNATFFIDKPDGPRLLSTMLSCTNLANAVTAVSPSDACFYLPWNSNARFVSNPLDHLPAITKPRESHGRRVVWVGRFDPVEKRLDLAIQAFAVLVKHVSDARLCLVGGGEPWQEEQIHSLVSNLDLDEKVEFTGTVRDATPQLTEADVFVLSSPTEGFPMALSEAMNAALPCVCFELPNAVVAQDCAGVIQVPFGDVEAMAQALADVLLADDAHYLELSRSVSEKIAQVRAIDVSAQWEQIFDLALGEEPAGHASDPASQLTRSFILGYQRQTHLLAVKQDEHESALEQAVQREEQARVDLDAVVGSVSFKVGRALTAVPRHLRNLLHHKIEKQAGELPRPACDIAMVEMKGLEPSASGLQSPRSPS